MEKNLDTEALLPMVTNLAEKYTSKDSSSVTYETARMLMGAVIYCVKEWEQSGETLPAAVEDKEYWARAYDLGYQKIIEKTYQAKALYESIAEYFEGYGCRNYEDTLLQGLPEFFVAYDYRFCPQDHILTLDYPPLYWPSQKTGIDLIFNYLIGIQIEQDFLRKWNPAAICGLLDRIMPEYESLYLDNICKGVLLVAAGCVLGGGDLLSLQVGEEGLKRLEKMFCGKSQEEVNTMLEAAVEMLAAGLSHPHGVSYLKSVTEEYSKRVLHGMEHQCLSVIFLVS